MAETLITSSVIILMLCAIRILFKGRIRPTVQYGLWGIAAARSAVFLPGDPVVWKPAESVEYHECGGAAGRPSGGPGSRCHSAFRRGSG